MKKSTLKLKDILNPKSDNKFYLFIGLSSHITDLTEEQIINQINKVNNETFSKFGKITRTRALQYNALGCYGSEEPTIIVELDSMPARDYVEELGDRTGQESILIAQSNSKVERDDDLKDLYTVYNGVKFNVLEPDYVISNIGQIYLDLKESDILINF